jgi:hypothetical protein
MTVWIVLFKLICRGLYFIYSIIDGSGRGVTLREVANNEAGFSLMMLIVVWMNKTKVHLIYVRNQAVAGFFVR